MSLELRLQPLRLPRLDMISLGRPSQVVSEITDRNRARAAHGAPESRAIQNAKEKMKRALIERWKRGRNISFEETTSGPGRERILLSLYLDYAGRADAPWLDTFDGTIADDLLGPDGRRWHPGRRRQATVLFFTHFNRLGGLEVLGRRLLEAYGVENIRGDGPASTWHQQRVALFASDGPQRLLRAATPRETLAEIIERFAVPTDPPGSQFQARLQECFLLGRLETAEMGGGQEVLMQIESMRTAPYQAGVLLGAAALRMMVQRVKRQGNGRWPGEWSQWITRLGCDPRHGRATAEVVRWWGWATDDELRLAQRGLTGLTLRFFIEYLRQSLEGAPGALQFERRAAFLTALETAQKIQDARVIVSAPIYNAMHTNDAFRRSQSVAKFADGNQEAKAIICLACSDDVFVIEGTHNFGLRAFHRQFPIADFWANPRRVYQRARLVVPQHQCPIFLTHGQGGGWVQNFFDQLARRFHVEWDDVHR